jgi:hypothetical protein
VTEDREHRGEPEADVPPVEEDTPPRDTNLEEQTVYRQEAGPGASKMENLRRMAKQVRTQEDRSKGGSRSDRDPEGDD